MSSAAAIGAVSPPRPSRTTSAIASARKTTPATTIAIGARRRPRCLRSIGGAARAGILREHPGLQLAKLAARFQPELFDAPQASLAICLQRVGLAPAAVQGEHELASQPVTQRVGLHERFDLGHERPMTGQGQIRVDALLQRRQAQLVEPRDLVLREPRVGEVDKGRSTPQLQAFAQTFGCVAVAPVRACPLAVTHVLLEPRDIDARRLDLEHVATGAGAQRGAVRSEVLA